MKTRFSFRKRKRGEKSFDLLMTLFFRSDSPWSFGKWGKDVEECFDSQTDFLEGRKKKFFFCLVPPISYTSPIYLPKICLNAVIF